MLGDVTSKAVRPRGTICDGHLDTIIKDESKPKGTKLVILSGIKCVGRCDVSMHA